MIKIKCNIYENYYLGENKKKFNDNDIYIHLAMGKKF